MDHGKTEMFFIHFSCKLNYKTNINDHTKCELIAAFTARCKKNAVCRLATLN